MISTQKLGNQGELVHTAELMICGSSLSRLNRETHLKSMTSLATTVPYMLTG
jgi:hypothetical protein